jgi:hypothetical protein
MGLNITDGLNKYLKLGVGQQQDQLPGMLIHPLYVELQSHSRLSDPHFQIQAIEVGGIGPHEFYSNYVSQSLPLLIKGGCESWSLFKEVQQRKSS